MSCHVKYGAILSEISETLFKSLRSSQYRLVDIINKPFVINCIIISCYSIRATCGKLSFPSLKQLHTSMLDCTAVENEGQCHNYDKCNKGNGKFPNHGLYDESENFRI
jgi:hypothetical protein